MALAAGSGLLYGSINVLAKPMAMHPVQKAAIAYVASALVLSPFLVRLRIARKDWPKVLAMGLFGAGIAPVLLFFGLQQTAAADSGLLLTLELVTTAALAFVFLHERFTGREVIGLASLLAAAATIAIASAGGTASGSTLVGVLFILGAAVAWGIDNAVSARLVGTYAPPGLIAVKGVIGASASLVAWAVLQPSPPAGGEALAMAGLGVVSIAVSSLLFYHALSFIGASRTSALNIATTALMGAGGGWLYLHEQLRPLHALALALVGLGAFLLARPSKASSTTAD